MPKIYVDIDETICQYPEERKYELAEPIPENIKKVNQLYDQGNTIVYWSARGTVTGIDYYPLTKQQFKTWGVKHHSIQLSSKPNYDLLIDDKAINSIAHWEDNIIVHKMLNKEPLHQKLCGLIPARHASSRLPGKPLLQINGKSIIQRTYEQACKSKYLEMIYIVTDHEDILNHCLTFCPNVIMIAEDCLNGTERICRALPEISDTYQTIVNIQGDEPFIDPHNIDFCIEKYRLHEMNPEMVCTTIHYPLTHLDEINNRGIGKMVLDRHDNVIYCSRSFIPHTKSGIYNTKHVYQGHIGIFVFRRSYLETEYMKENTPCQLVEDIEWLKIIEQGYRIKSYQVEGSEIGINTQEDYNYLSQKYSGL